MYPGFAKTAREEGFTEVAEWFETLARAEKSHAGRFQKGLDTLGSNCDQPLGARLAGSSRGIVCPLAGVPGVSFRAG